MNKIVNELKLNYTNFFTSSKYQTEELSQWYKKYYQIEYIPYDLDYPFILLKKILKKSLNN